MRSPFGNSEIVRNEIQATYVPGRDAIVPTPKFGAVCKLLWPANTAAHLAAIAKKRRTHGKAMARWRV